MEVVIAKRCDASKEDELKKPIEHKKLPDRIMCIILKDGTSVCNTVKI